PTEVEWEVAARGPNGSTFPWSSQAPYCQKLNKDRIQMTGESPAEVDRRMAKNGHSAPHARCGGGRHGTIEGGGYGLDVSWIGVEDLGGNVREWVADEYAAYPGGRTNPGLSGRVNRGGSWS
ncbi:MAG: SUMF1/EgtB/PvdO family nonheme iron enzyme, partial [Myxococcota bacterium]|nr:SUMF1/EgtB/PvdO family nonheme iron enzyme [Myxococcota bacterium]